MATAALVTVPAAPAIAPARLSSAATGTFVVLLAALHVLKPEIDPSWRFISEYAIGDHGWLMAAAFLSLAAAHVALALALRSYVRSAGGRIGLALFLTGAAGLTLAGLFPMDPITTPPDAATTSGTLHNVGGSLGIAGLVGTLILTWRLARHPHWSAARRALLMASGAVVLGFVVMVGSLGFLLSQSGGAFGPEVPVGWPNRFEIATSCAWLLVVAHLAGGVRRRSLAAPRE